MRILTVDIETEPNEVYSWGLHKQFIAINQIKKPAALLCFAAKFRGEKKVHFHSSWDDGRRGMARKLLSLFNEADAVCGWNSDKFDIRWINAELMLQGLGLPSPYAKVDLMKSVRRQFALPSYKLGYVAPLLGVGYKLDPGGFHLWRDVMRGDSKAQSIMRRYNIHDTNVTEGVFDKLHAKGWVLGLPNHSITDGDVCPNCGSENLRCEGTRESKTRTYQRYQCRDCLTWIKSVNSLPRRATLVVA